VSCIFKILEENKGNPQKDWCNPCIEKELAKRAAKATVR
jgi:hypothetical protein